jgi:hypothetical protein
MPLTRDPEIYAALDELAAVIGEVQEPPVGDVETRRRGGHRMFDLVLASRAPVDDVTVEGHVIAARDGALLPARWYHRAGDRAGQCGAVSKHGGGMIMNLEHRACLRLVGC